jgi:hypothetical protein
MCEVPHTNIIAIGWRSFSRFNFLIIVALGGSPARVERSHNLYGIVITIVVVVTGDIAYKHNFACCNE